MAIAKTPCQLGDPDDWFVDKQDDPENWEKRRRRAKQGCWDCFANPHTRAARMACLMLGLENPTEWGIWGGYDERERREMTRR